MCVNAWQLLKRLVLMLCNTRPVPEQTPLAGMRLNIIVEVVSLQGLWTDGHLAFTVALDQRLHCWEMKRHTQLRMHRCKSDSRGNPVLAHDDKEQTVEQCHAAASVASDVSDRILWEQEPQSGEASVWLLGSDVTQVLEPAALDAVYSSADQTYHVLVAGRGTQLLDMRM